MKDPFLDLFSIIENRKKSKLKKSYKIFKDAGATGVPTIIIDGNYMTSSTMAGGEQNAIDITNYIIENIRNDQKKPQ